MLYSEMRPDTYLAPEVDIIEFVDRSAVLCASGAQIDNYEPTDLGSDVF